MSDPKLHISNELALPLSFVTSKQAILAKARVGKSYTAQVEAEELLEANQQVIVIDPTGAWYGLRSSPDGRSTGYPISIIGGKHGDAPLELDSGARWAEAVVVDRFSAIFDISLFDIEDWSTFIAAFLSTLYRLNESAMHLFIDEADVACPQTPEDKEQQKALRATNNIVRRGGIKGIGCTLISQRPALINKNVLYMIDQLVVLQMNGELDLKQIRGWVKAHDLKDDVASMIASLPSLPKGEAWVWSPGADIFQRVKIRRKHTFDSGRTPEPGEAHVAPKVLAPVDVKRLGKSIASAVERAEANDPTAMRKKIAELEARIASGEGAPRIVEKRMVADDDLCRLEAVAEKCDALSKRIDDIGGELHEGVEDLAIQVADLRAAIQLADQLPNGEPVTAAPRAKKSSGNRIQRSGETAAAKATPYVPDGHPTRAHRNREDDSKPSIEGNLDAQSVLNALATLERIGIASTITMLALWLGRHPKNKNLLGAIGELRRDGMIDGLALTGNGASIATPEKLDERGIRDRLAARVTESEQRIVDTISSLKRSLSHKELAAWVGLHPKNKNLLADLGSLRERGFVDGTSLTDLGKRIASPRFANLTVDDVLTQLDDHQRAIAQVVLKRGSVGSITELADATSLHPKNKNLLGAVGALRERGLFTAGWPLKPTNVFPGVAS